MDTDLLAMGAVVFAVLLVGLAFTVVEFIKMNEREPTDEAS